MDNQLDEWAAVVLNRLVGAISAGSVTVTKLNLQRYDDDYDHGDWEGLSLEIMVEPNRVDATD